MEQFDDLLSSELDSMTADLVTKKPKPNRRIPKCARCQNHDKEVAVRFHTKDCEYKYCNCVMCQLVGQRQEITRMQTANRRERHRQEMLMKLRIQRAKLKDSVTPPAPSVNSSNDSNSSDLPSLGGTTTNNEVVSAAPNNISNSNSAKPRRNIGKPVVSVPQIPQNRTSLLPYTASPGTTLYEPESSIEQVEVLLSCSAGLLQQFGYPWESLSLMYVILKDSRADVEATIRRITKANREIQAMAQFKASRFGTPYYYPRYSGSLSTLGNPTYFGQVPYVGMASPPTTTGLGIFPHSLNSQVLAAKVPSSPDSPPERPSSYPEMSLSHCSFKIEKPEHTD